MKKIIFGLMFLFVFLSGCAVTPPFSEALIQLNESRVCCSSFSQIQYHHLPANKELDGPINNQSPSYMFESGKSFFVAFRLPRVQKNSKLVVKSYIGADVFVLGTSVFVPVFTVLDGNYKVTRTTDGKQVKYVAQGWVEKAHMLAELDLEPGSKDRYVIIHTTSDLIGSIRSESYTSTNTLYLPGGTMAMTSSQERNNTRFTSVGNISIILSSM